jgi:plastocyanin domain-containing protein
MNKNTLISTTIVFVAIVASIFIFGSNTNNNSSIVSNTEIKNGVQYITIDAGGGYSPRLSSAKAGIPTKLIMKTSGSFDCSSSLVIRSLNYQKILPQTGETEIDLGIPKVGEPIKGICSMGMYNFTINFN